MNSAPVRLLAGLALALLGAVPAWCETYTVTAITQADLGNVVSAATGDTTFVAPANGGTVSKTGNGVRLSTGAVRAMVTVSCSNVTTGGSGSCGTGRQFDVRIVPAGVTGRTKAFTSFSAVVGTPTTALVSGPTLSGTTLTFRAGGMAAGATRTFYVGFTVPVGADNSGLASGSATASFSAEVKQSAVATYGTAVAGALVAKVFRPISMTKTSDLAFGRMVRPSSGSGVVTINPTTGSRTSTAGAGLGTPSPSRAAFSVSGEGAQAFSVAVPATFVMANGASSLTVTTTTTATGTPTLSATLGSAGTYNFGVGGSVPITSTTPTGAYTGTFNVTVQYN